MEKYRVYADGNYQLFVEADTIKFAVSLAEDLIRSHRKPEIKRCVECKDGKIRWYKVRFELGRYKDGRRFIYLV